MNPKLVLAVVFNESLTETVLVVKNRPAFLADKLNGVGGGVEEFDENDHAAAIRELEEEADVTPDFLFQIGVINGPNFQCTVFTGTVPDGTPVTTKTDEPVAWYKMADLPKSSYPLNLDIEVYISFALNLLKQGITDKDDVPMMLDINKKVV